MSVSCIVPKLRYISIELVTPESNPACSDYPKKQPSLRAIQPSRITALHFVPAAQEDDEEEEMDAAAADFLDPFVGDAQP